jgi:predicted DNA-binding transcriptional regulator YafY
MSNRSLYDVGISRRTLQRDIDYIRTEFGIDIQYDKRMNGYYIEDNGLKSVLDNFLESFEVFNSLNGGREMADYVLPERHSPQGAHHLSPLLHAIKNAVQITFSYQKFGETTASIRQLEPCLLKEFRGRWYLIGRTVGLQDMKIYGLDRITELEVSDNSFKKDKQVNIAQQFQDSFGIYSTENFPVEDVILLFDQGDGNYLKSLPLHHSQEIVKDDDQAFIIKLHLRITPDFVMEILSRGWSLKVIQPDSLRKQVHEICRSAAERN